MNIYMVSGKVGITLGREITALARTGGKSLFAIKPVKVNTTGLKPASKLKTDVVQISGNSSRVSHNVTSMADNFSNELREIEKSLVQATDHGSFANLSERISRLPDSPQREMLQQKLMSRFKVFKNPFVGVRNNFSQIFGRQLSEQEVRQLCQRYKDIFGEQDNIKFLGRLYQQIMRDFRINPGKLEFKLGKCHASKVADITKEGDRLTLYVGDGACLTNPENRIKAMNAICHELTHLKQNMIAYGTSPEAYTEAIARYAQKQGLYSGISLKEAKAIVRTNIQQGVLVDAPNISLDSQLGQRGKDYINGTVNYRTPQNGQLQYAEQLIEKEAFEAGDMAEQSIRFILARLV